MKLSAYARQIGATYKTAYRWWKAGKLDAYQLDTGTVIVRDPLPKSAMGVALYARVSSVAQISDLECQMHRSKDYAAVHGDQVTHMVQEIGSGSNDRRPQFLKLLTALRMGVIILEQRDWGTRFGFIYLEQLLARLCPGMELGRAGLCLPQRLCSFFGEMCRKRDVWQWMDSRVTRRRKKRGNWL